MRVLVQRLAALTAIVLHAAAAHADDASFRFSVISHPFAGKADSSALNTAIAATDADSLAFVVINGIKEADEACSDNLYEQRATLLSAAQNGIVVSLAASDWAYCRNNNGRSTAINRLARLRELLFGDEFSLGSSKIPLLRQSITPKFRSYVENARWEIGSTMFATVNVPDNNNHYVSDAGRNSEFEDRAVANRDWLQRVFIHAMQKKMDGIVLFSDANPLAAPRPGRRDGYLELRRQINALSNKFPGKILLVYSDAGRPASKAVRWRGNLGELNIGAGTSTVTVSAIQPYYAVSGR